MRRHTRQASSAARHTMSESAREAAYNQGYADGRFDEREYLLRVLAERVDELEAIWRPIRRKSYEEKVAERIALFEEAARRTAKELSSSAETAADWPPVARAGAKD